MPELARTEWGKLWTTNLGRRTTAVAVNKGWRIGELR